MTGLFGGHSQPVVAPVASPVASPDAQAAADANKGATDLQKLKDKKTRKDTYSGASLSDLGKNIFSTSEDTTLASGSLLSLGSTLGNK